MRGGFFMPLSGHPIAAPAPEPMLTYVDCGPVCSMQHGMKAAEAGDVHQNVFSEEQLFTPDVRGEDEECRFRRAGTRDTA